MEKEQSLLSNTIALYIRMFFSVCVNLYLSRVVLDILGVVDFGIYNVVGGIVVFLGFINSSMNGATSRFFTIAIGEKDIKKLEDTYSASKQLQIFISLLIFVLGETIGLWIVNTYLSIPEDRIIAANIIYQLSILTTVFTILQVPYSSIIISKERFDVYAKIEIASIIFKLLLVLPIKIIPIDLLICYGLVLLAHAIITFGVYYRYCGYHYSDLHFLRKLKMDILRPIFFFSGWDLLGWGGVSLRQQGAQILINNFFSIAANAANAVAGTASSLINTFTNNVIMAFRPRIIKLYAAKDVPQMQSLTEGAMIIIIFLMSIIIVPAYFLLDDLLNLWLVEVPDHTLDFCRLLLVFNFIEVINTVVKIGIHATGKMKLFSILGAVINVTNVILTYILYKLGWGINTTYHVTIILSVLNVVINIVLLKNMIPSYSCKKMIKTIIIGLLICFIAAFCVDTIKEIEVAETLFAIIVCISNFIIISLLHIGIYYKEVFAFIKLRKES